MRAFATGAIEGVEGYESLLAEAGFREIETEDLTAEWIPILGERLEMYRGLRDETVARFGEARYQEYDAHYAFFVGLVEAGHLGGARFDATR